MVLTPIKNLNRIPLKIQRDGLPHKDVIKTNGKLIFEKLYITNSYWIIPDCFTDLEQTKSTADKT